MKQPTATLPDDILCEIFVRLPYKSLCRFKCVSRSWHALCSDSKILWKLPWTISGFFYSLNMSRNDPFHNRNHFANMDGRGLSMFDPSFSFLPVYTNVELIDCCNGLLLLRCRKTSLCQVPDYIVCNPAMMNWIMLPNLQGMDMIDGFHELYLGFDPVVSSHFIVFLLVQALQDDNVHFQTIAVWIYSSENREWTYKQSGWTYVPIGLLRPESAFFNGTLHLITYEFSVLTIDMEGKTWRTIPTPQNFSFIGLSQGHLYATHKIPTHELYDIHDPELDIWILKDYDGAEWELKHTVSARELFGVHYLEYSKLYKVFAIHPEFNSIFVHAGSRRNLMSYDMDSRKVHDICSLGEYCVHLDMTDTPSLPYIPCFSDCLPDGH